MDTSPESDTSTERSALSQRTRSAPAGPPLDLHIARWGGVAGLAGVVAMLTAVLVVVGFGLPDASDVETLTDYPDIAAGRIAEHFSYLAAVVLFALHVLVVHRLVRAAHAPAALFGAAVAEIGYVIMAASAVLHVSTSPLSDLYTAPDVSEGDRETIEYVWHGTQSVFDMMLATGLLLVPIGIVLLGIAMRSAAEFGGRLGSVAIGLGTVGTIGAAVEIIDGGVELSALSVLAIVVFHLVSGWRTFVLGTPTSE